MGACRSFGSPSCSEDDEGTKIALEVAKGLEGVVIQVVRLEQPVEKVRKTKWSKSRGFSVEFQFCDLMR